MNKIIRLLYIFLYGTFFLSLSACSPEIGSDQWCSDIKEKSKSDLSSKEVANFTKHCILK